MKYKIAVAIIINEKEEILLTKRAREPFKGKWALISGIGESVKGINPKKGIVEEVRCDLGTESFQWSSFYTVPIEGDDMTDEAYVFIGKIDDKEIQIDPQFSQGIKWVPVKDVSKFVGLAFDHEKYIKIFWKKKNSDIRI